MTRNSKSPAKSTTLRRKRSLEEFRRLIGDLSGKALIAAMQASPHRDIDLEPGRTRMPVRNVSL